jgi:hypothetical protein
VAFLEFIDRASFVVGVPAIWGTDVCKKCECECSISGLELIRCGELGKMQGVIIL